jgi:hypothetical protein
VTTEDALKAALAQTQMEDSQEIREILATVTAVQQQAAANKGTGSGTSGAGSSGGGGGGSTAAPSGGCPNVAVACSATPATASGSTGGGGNTGGSVGGGGAGGGGATPSAPAKIDTNLGPLTLPGATVDFDQALKFRAAAALLQEVALLNHYVRDAAVAAGTKPYIVRMLVTVLPAARNEPYDAYTTVTFFEDTDRSIEPLRSFPYRNLLRKINADRAGREADKAEGLDPKPRTMNDWSPEDEDVINRLEGTAGWHRCAGRPVSVIPLLVTDDLESSLHSNSFQRIRDLALAAQALLNTTSVTAGARSHAEDLDKTLNRNLNSIYTVGQVAPNAIQARLGAIFNNGRFVTVPRTYSVSLLILVGTGAKYEKTPIAYEMVPCPSVSFVAHSRMRDAITGRFLRDRDDWTWRDLTRELVATLDMRGKDAFDDAERLLDDAARADYDAFDQHFRGRDVRTAYTKAIAIAQSGGRSAGVFRLSLSDARLPAVGERAALIDDGKAMRLTLGPGRNLLRDRIDGTVKVQLTDRWLILKATNVDVTPDGRTALLTFPSVTDLIAKPSEQTYYAEVRLAAGLREWQSTYNETWFPSEPVSPRPLPESAPGAPRLCLDRLRGLLADLVAPQVCKARAENVIHSDEIPISYFATLKSPTMQPEFTLKLPSRRILAQKDGTGELMIELRSTDSKKPAQVHFQVADAFIDTVLPAVPLIGADHVASDGAYLLKLKNLIPKTQVTVRAFVLDNNTEKGATSDIADVIAKEEPPKDQAGAKEKP